MSDDSSLTEDRVYADKGDHTSVFVATGTGVVRVSVSDDIVGEFSLLRRGSVTDIASVGERIAIGTADDVLILTESGFEATGFGPANAVGADENGALLAAGEGRLGRYRTDWTTLDPIDTVRAIDSGMIAAAGGVYRPDGTHVGLEAANDVSATGAPLAATDSGLYYLANGWMCAMEGEFDVVASDGDRSLAATTETCYTRSGPDFDAEWQPVEFPVGGSVAAVGYGNAVYAVTEDGTFLADAGDGWRHRSLGVPDVTGLAVW